MGKKKNNAKYVGAGMAIASAIGAGAVAGVNIVKKKKGSKAGVQDSYDDVKPEEADEKAE